MDEKELNTWRFRFFTKKMPNKVVLVRSAFQKSNGYIIKKGIGFSMPWEESRYVDLADQEIESKYNTCETLDNIAGDVKVTYKISVKEPSERDLGKNISSFFADLKSHPILHVLTDGGFICASAIITALTTPWVLIPAGVVAGVHLCKFQSKDVNLNEGISKFMNQKNVYRIISNEIETYIRSYVRSKNVADLRETSINIHPGSSNNADGFGELRTKVKELEERYGVNISSIRISDFSKDKRSQEIANDKAENDAEQAFINAKLAMGFTKEQVTQMLIEKYRRDAIMNGNVQNHNIINNSGSYDDGSQPINNGPQNTRRP